MPTKGPPPRPPDSKQISSALGLTVGWRAWERVAVLLLVLALVALPFAALVYVAYR
jgi:hypothetical protein